MAKTRYNVTPLNRYNDKGSGAQSRETTRCQTFEDRFLRQKKAGKASALHEGETDAAFDEDDDPFGDVPL